MMSSGTAASLKIGEGTAKTLDHIVIDQGDPWVCDLV